jgi:hypothetical protein
VLIVVAPATIDAGVAPVGGGVGVGVGEGEDGDDEPHATTKPNSSTAITIRKLMVTLPPFTERESQTLCRGSRVRVVRILSTLRRLLPQGVGA